MVRKSNQFYRIDLDGEPINHLKNFKANWNIIFSVLSSQFKKDKKSKGKIFLKSCETPMQVL